jgi:probable F420-dependent oxidoreductase
MKLILILSENWTIFDARDVRAQVRMAVEAEDAGFDGVMVSEHVVLGPSSNERGLPANPRDFVLPGNQDPRTPWPSSLVILSGVAATTTRLRLVAGAVIAPLRHPLILAKELGTLDLLAEGRLVVLPTPSWHRDEYAALGIPFNARGRILDEQLTAWESLWSGSPASFAGEHFQYADVYFEPAAHRPAGPTLWFGGASAHPQLVRRLARYGSGWLPMGPPSAEDVKQVSAGLSAAGRDLRDLEMVGGIVGVFPDATSVASLDDALAAVPPQLAAGMTSLVVKPSQFIDDPAQFPAFAREVVAKVAALAS